MGLSGPTVPLLDSFSFDDTQSTRTTSEDQSARRPERAFGESTCQQSATKSIHAPTTLYRELRHSTQLRDVVVDEEWWR